MTDFPVKIGIVGTHSTGKTSSLEQARVQLEAMGIRAVVLPSNAARTLAAGFEILTGHTSESTLYMICDQISAELVAMRTTDVLLVDRAVLDALVYYCAALRFRNEEMPKSGSLLYSIVEGYSCTYATIFRTVLDERAPLGVLKTRDGNREFRKLVDSMIEEVASHVGCAICPLAQELDGAVSQILASIVLANDPC